LPAAFAKDGDVLRNSRILIAPPSRHLIVDGAKVALGIGPRENNARPAIDPMLRSAALCCGHRTVGAVLTGTLGDGAAGLWAISQCGGATVVQDPHDAAFPEMPLNALNRSRPQHVVRLAELPALLERLVRQPAAAPLAAPPRGGDEGEGARSGRLTRDEMDRIGRRSVLACPDCHGVMWEIDEGDVVRYRCHVGHAYAADTMSMALDENLRQALGSALRALEERIALAERLRRQAADRGQDEAAESWAATKLEHEAEADVIRNAVRRADELAVRERRRAASE
jgi:two-component system chemotaxis response regulator CheB